MPPRTIDSRPTVLAVWLVIAGAIGWFAAFALTTEKFHALANPGSGAASCDFSPLVQCTKNLDSWQGSVFGFPNPILGLTGWVAPIVVGAALLAGGMLWRMWSRRGKAAAVRRGSIDADYHVVGKAQLPLAR